MIKLQPFPMEQFAKETLPISLEEEMRRSYLDYAMSVIVGRALPDVRDGLKPVHRRVPLCDERGEQRLEPAYVKCARIVGDVLGKYHPHGDAATYEALVRMAQDFSMRYPLIDGQGNFGSVDGDPAARHALHRVPAGENRRRDAGRHRQGDGRFRAELRRQGAGADSAADTVPNLLVNGSSGIAVGMATNIPPHNLGEVVDACIALIASRSFAVEELMQADAGAGLPDRGNHLRSLRRARGIPDRPRPRGVRARTHFEEIGKGDRHAVIVTSCPTR